MANTIQIKRNTSGVPSGLAAGELAVNLSDNKLYVGNAAEDGVIHLNPSASGTLTSTGDFTIDSGDGIILDADGGAISLKDGGTRFGVLENSSSNFVIQNPIDDKDILFKIKDGGTVKTALTLDGSENGNATFGGTITATGGTLSSGTSGQTASSGADELVVSGADHTGISILAPAAKRSQLYFNDDAFLRWVENDGVLSIDTSSSSSKISLAPSGADVGINCTPAVRLDVLENDADWAARIKNTHTNGYGLSIDCSANSGTTVFALAAYTGSGTGFFVKNDGTAGLGLTAPSSKLHVNSEISCGADDNNRAMFGYTPSRFYLGTRQSGTNYLNTVSVTSGKVGINQPAPSSLLHLYNSATSGNTQLHIHNDKTGDAAVLKLEGKRTGGSDAGQVLFANNSNSIAMIRSHSSGDDGDLKFYTSPSGSGSALTERLTIASAGATTIKSGGNSSYPFAVISSLDSDKIFGVYQDADGDGAAYVLDKNNSSKVGLSSNGNSWFTGGNLGLGSVSPSSLLHLYSSAPVLTIQDGGTWGTNATGYIELKDSGSTVSMIGVTGTAGHLDIKHKKAGSIRMFTNDAERLTIASAGRVTFSGTTGADGVVIAGGESNNFSARLFFDNGVSGESAVIRNENGAMQFLTAGTPGSSSGTKRVIISNAALYPNDNAFSLGLTSKRWNIYGTTGDFSGNLTFDAKLKGGTGANSWNPTVGLVFDAGASTSYDLISVGNNNGEHFNVKGDGSVTLTGDLTTGSTANDAPLFQNIVKSGTVIARLTANRAGGDAVVGTNSAHDFLIQRGGNTRLTLSGSSVVVNDTGENIDFRVEGDGDQNLIRTDASNDRVGIKTASPAYTFHCVGTGYFSQAVSLSSGLTAAGAIQANGGFITERADNNNFITMTATGNETWTIAGRSGSDPNDYLDIGATGGGKISIHESGSLELSSTDAVAQLTITPTGTNANARVNIIPPGTGRAIFQYGGTEKISYDATDIVLSNNLQVGNSVNGQTKLVTFNSEGGAEVGLLVKSRTNRAKIRVADNDTSAYIVAENLVRSFGAFSTAASNNFNILASGFAGLGLTAPTSRLHLKDSVDNTFESGLCIERSADAAKTWINTKGGATNFNNLNNAGSSGLSYKWFANGSQKMELNPSNGLIIGADDIGLDVRFYGATSGRYWEWDESDDLVRQRDGVKTTFGNGTDLMIWHDGSNSYLQQGSNGGNLNFTNSGGTKFSAIFKHADAVELYFNGSKKFETLNTGVKVTGTLQADVLNNAANSANIIYRSGSSTIVGNNANALVVLDNGNTGLGTAAPARKLDVDGRVLADTYGFRSDTTLRWYYFDNYSGSNFMGRGGNAYTALYDTGVLSMSWKEGLVGIGTTAPTSKLHVTGDLGNSAFLAYIYNSGTQSEDNGLNVQIASSGSSAMGLRVNTGGDSNAFIVAGDGDTGLGFTPSNFAQKLNVNGGVYINGNLGLGRSSPSARLDILDPTDGGISWSTFLRVGRRSGDSTNELELKSLHDGSDEVDGFAVFLHGGECLAVDHNKRLFLNALPPGTYAEATYADDFVLGDTGNHAGMTIRSGTSHAGSIYFADGVTGDQKYRGYIEYNHNGDLMSFGAGAGGRLRISSGGVAVNSTPDGGLKIKSTGDGVNVLNLTDSSDDAMFNVRQSGNDCLIRGYKDGGTQTLQFHSDGESYIKGGSGGNTDLSLGGPGVTSHGTLVFNNGGGSAIGKIRAEGSDDSFYVSKLAGGGLFHFTSNTLFQFNQHVGIGITPTNTRLDVQHGSGNILRCKGDSGNTRFAVGASGACTIEANTGSYALDITNADSGKKGIRLADSVKTVWGNDADLQIYHDGSNSYIKDNGTGSLLIEVAGTGDSGFYKIGGEKLATFEPDGPVSLYHNNVKKFETTSYGVAINSRLEVSNDTDTYSVFGRAKIGYIGHGDYAGFSHIDAGGTGNYALIQSSAGATFLNSALNQSIFFRQNNTTFMVMTSGALYPNTDGAKDLGLNGNRWNNVYSEAGNFSGAVTTGRLTVPNDVNYRAANISEINSSISFRITKTRLDQTKAIAMGCLGSSNTDTGIQCYDTSNNSANTFSIQPFGGSITFNSAFTFPTTDGSANQVLKTNGSGTLSWADQSGGSYSLPTASTSTKGGIKIDSSDFTVNSSTAVMTLHSSVPKKYASYVQMDVNSNTHQVTLNHGLGTYDLVVQVRTASTGNYSRSQRFSGVSGVLQGRPHGRHLDIGHDVDIVSCDSNGAMSTNHISLDFTEYMNTVGGGYDDEYLYVSVIG